MAATEPDFANYMEDLQQVEANQARNEAMYSAHEEWRSNTWGGWAVKQLIAIGQHFRPFFLAISQSIAEDKSIGFRLLSHFVRMALIAALMLSLYSAARVFQMVIGNEIVQQQEIVILEEIPRSRAIKEGIVEGEEELSPEEAREHLARIDRENAEAAAVAEAKGPRRNARDKKQL